MCTQTTYNPGKVKLTPKQRRFIEEYCVARTRQGAESGLFLNATKAAIVAGYGKKTAAQAASRLLKNVKVQAEVNARLRSLMEKSGATAQEVLERVSRIARIDVGGTLEEARHAGVVLDALELLGKYYKLWTEKREISDNREVTIQFALPRMDDSEDPRLPEEGAP